MRRLWPVLKAAAYSFIQDDALSRGAAIAYYTIFAIGPVLLIVVAMVGLFFGRAAAQGAIVGQLAGLMGKQSADVVQSLIESAARARVSWIATLIGVVTLIITASGVFGELQSSLNIIWKAPPPKSGTVTNLLKARALGLGLVAAMGFLLLVSLVVSAALAALATYVTGVMPEMETLLIGANFVVSFALISVMFAAIYKILPDKRIEWGDVGIGAVSTALLFTIGKGLIALYLGSSSVASSYGAAGSLLVTLLWIYYSAQIFLFGAEFTKAYAETHGSRAAALPGMPEPVGHEDLDRRTWPCCGASRGLYPRPTPAGRPDGATDDLRGHSSVGRAPEWHSGGRRFDSAWLQFS